MPFKLSTTVSKINLIPNQMPNWYRNSNIICNLGIVLSEQLQGTIRQVFRCGNPECQSSHGPYLAKAVHLKPSQDKKSNI
jgi:aspartate carbamoyltransferase regulatory subunit